MIKNSKKNKKGFTLVEVIIVLAIIAIIAAIAIPSLTKVRQESKIKADAQSIESLVRTVNMLITDETIDFNNTQIVITIDEAGIVDSDELDDATKDEIKEYIGNIKSPQEEGKNKFQITIKDDATITGTTMK